MATVDSEGVLQSDARASFSNSQQGALKDSHSPPRSAKRQKVTRACDSCKSRKRRCTGEWPCTSCGWSSSGAECTYKASYTRGKLVQPLPSSRPADTTSVLSAEEGRQIQSNDLYQSRPGTSTVGGVNSNGETSRAASPEGEAASLAGQYSGPTSAYSFLHRAWRRFGLNVNQQQDRESSQAVPIFSYGDKQLPRSTVGITLPNRQSTSEMFALYFDFAMPTYRFLHQPTASAWLQSYHEQVEQHVESTSLLPARQAIVLMVLATASLFQADSNTENTIDRREAWQNSEPYFQAAQAKLASETGRVRLESVQARLAICLYLLHTSRPNQAWYTFGITSQILMALGMHRARASSTSGLDAITTECRKRALWAAFTLDTYLSVILGRPTLIHSDDVDQEFPEAVDDEDIGSNGILANRLRRDPVIQGSIFHAKITRIAKKALKEQYSVHKHRDAHRLAVATRLSAEVAEWRSSLPVVLSGAVHPSSLIQIFQRQIMVLDLAYSLAVILINRPLLLIDSNVDNKNNVNSCLTAAKSILDTVLQFISDTRAFPAFWYTQNVTFNALSVVYVWLIQRKRGRLSGHQPPTNDDELYQLAETIQKHLAEATHMNAPSLRYSIILEELQQEASRLMVKSNQPRPPNLKALLETPNEAHPYATPVNMSDSSPSSTRAGSLSWDSLSGDFPLDPDIWLQLDSFPFPDISFDEMGNLT